MNGCKSQSQRPSSFSVYGIAEAGVNTFDFQQPIRPAKEKLIGCALSEAAFFHNCARPAPLLSCWQKKPSHDVALAADFRSPPVRPKRDGSGLNSSKR